ncbi:bifunctional UDP-N-acetylmuramoyl-tripeptide:D-alanyl-D-alanine ligase/alanine racemase [Ginsengibacter hankyongi]|uniref:Alanine racemase n=2 Tax=Ginsengibacter hankyongi TaxID=2607284 RepID=A0A5J5IQH4_9BACT|nr:bifunctional UDP-N-acetylmuramoyl-tripeptide:D-alanyl-D-alanine ligase/alanine racemase [Ginsengibacter hankyongi]
MEELAKVTKGKLINKNIDLPVPLSLSLDSRKIIDTTGTIFFAIKSSHHDGNKFIEGLYAKGVRNFVTTDKNISTKKLPLANIILVNNTVHALQLFAAYHRAFFKKLTVIGITGSNGKTIVKEWLNQLLEENFSIVRSPKSYNSQIGVPLSVLNINKSHNLAIFEAGISQPGEMNRLEKIIKPSIGLLTNIGNAHDEGFENRTEKINEKLQLFVHAKQLVCCADDEKIMKVILAFQSKINAKNKALELFTWGKSGHNKLQVLAINKSKSHTKIKAIYKDENVSISIPFADEASIENAINCWCVLLLLNKSDEQIRKKFEFLYPIAMRLELKQGINHCTIINDSYSNDLHSLEIALNFLEQQKQHKKHTVILSDILQSGKHPHELYKEVAKLFKHRKIDRLIGIGTDIFSMQMEFSFLKEKRFFKNVDEFLLSFNHLNFQDETVLIKGARSFSFEEISHKLEQKAHQTVLSINLNAIVHNLKQYKSLLRPGTKIMAMVKAFSYGSGGFEIASVLEYNKVDYLAVAYADEGVELRKAGITLPVMVMNAEPSTFESIVNYNLEPEIFSFNILNEFGNFLKSSGINYYPVHIKIDTGMHRLGFTSEDIDALNDMLKGNSLIKVVSVFTHLVAAENVKEDEFTLQQSKIFKNCCERIEDTLGYKFIKHISNTAGITRHPHLQMDMVRLGIGLYGIDGNKKMQQRLKNVTTLTTTVAQIKKVKAGDTVGYGRNARLQKDSTIATVRIGYADGYPRSVGNGIGKMMLHGKMLPVVGNVCMDMTMLDITELEAAKEGDEVIVFGESLPLNLLAAWSQTIPYEIMTGISQRVKRVYFEE